MSFLQAMFQAACDDGLLEMNPRKKVKRERYIDAGLAQLDAGEGIPHDEVKRRIGL